MNEHVTAVRQLAQAVNQIASVEVPELEIDDSMIINEGSSTWVDVQQDDDWWAAFCEIESILESTVGGVEPGETGMNPDAKKQYESLEAKTEYTSISVRVHADGDVRMLAEYDRGDPKSWTVMYDGRLSNDQPDPIELGREVASAELAILTTATHSCADALDYWITTMAPKSFRQSRWADFRDVGRSAVSERVKSAKLALIRDHGPDDLHAALNAVDSGDTLEFGYISGAATNVTGGGTYRVEEVIEPFGDGHGHIRCTNPVDNVVTDIKEKERADDQRVAIEQDGELAHVAGYVTIS